MLFSRLVPRHRGAGWIDLSRHGAWLLATAATTVLTGTAFGQTPQGGVVVSGQASITQDAARTTIQQTSTRAVVDWQGFDVGRQHQVDFQQPGAHAATLNRITQGGPSTIAGHITAPGTVIIQNQAGVVFSGSARVDVGGLIATTQMVDAARFQAGHGLDITGGEHPEARLVNEGSITVAEAGLVALVGSHVANHGSIVANKGTVALASGERTTIDLTGDGLARIVVDGDTVAGHVVNTGLIDAPGGQVLLTAGDAARTLDGAINTSGVIRAASAEADGGSIALLGRGAGAVQVAGLIDASGNLGGDVTVTGETVRLTADARIDASGTGQGGDVRLGGNRLGAPPLRRADALTMTAGATIDAGSSQGGGGSVVLWSDDTTVVDGRITAAGATAGGFVETSGREHLGIGATAEVTAGAGGKWLLDPRDVVIGNPGADASNDFDVPPGDTPFRINRVAVVQALNDGTDVTITTAQPASTMAGDITVEGGGLNWTGAGSLTLLADQDILLNALVRSQGNGSFTADAARNLVINDDVQANDAGNVSLIARTGDVIATNTPAGNRQIATNEGNLALTAVAGSVLLRRPAGLNNNVQVYSVTGAVDITAGQEIRLEGGDRSGTWVRVGRVANPSDITLRAARIVVEGGSVNDSFAEVVTGTGGSITLDAAERITITDGSGAPGRVTALFGSTLTMLAPEQVWDGRVRSGPTFAGGDVRLAGAITASVTPEFDLAANRHFTFDAATPSGAPSSYTGPAPLTVITRAGGGIDVQAPVSTSRIELLSEERVILGPGASLTGSDSGDAVVVAAGRLFQNDAGSDVITTTDPTARWLVYIDTFAGMVGTEPGPRAFDLYGRPFADTPPASLAGFSGNRIVYGEQPWLTLTGDNLTKTYGEAVSPGFSFSGLRPGDTLIQALQGDVTVTSDGAPANAPVTGSPFAVTVAAGVSEQGYLLNLVDGSITVLPAALTITADDAARLRGEANPDFTASFDGFVLGETVADLDGALAFTTPATPSSNVGAYAITPSGLGATNYVLTFEDGTLTVNPVQLTVTADDAARPAGAANPPFTASFDGFVLGETVADLAGSLSFTTPATPASPPGAFPITPGGLSATNYLLSFVDGTLTINAAPPPPPPPPPLPPPIDPEPTPPPVDPTPPQVDPGPIVPPVDPPAVPDPNPPGTGGEPGDGPGVSGLATLGGLTSLIEPFDRGLPPITPGDASFRTTLSEAGPSVADPFALGFSLGSTVQQAPVDGAAALAAIAPAAAPAGGPDDIAEALAEIAPGAGPADVTDGAACAGPVNAGAPAANCATVTVVDDFWSGFIGGTP
ncbi:MAG: filamentous hemagglutinin N-terminal domain-containing protein [Geminicoccaceae bacterium]|nr:MAG: filamentous hemagglutinin N-terminal domain-containing protein [Geminicoccaceae bacterium]